MKEKDTNLKKTAKGSKSICLPFLDQVTYLSLIIDTQKCREFLENLYERYPELFPVGFESGFIFKGFTEKSKKQKDFQMRRIKVKSTGKVYQIRPSFMMPYLVGKVEEVEKAMYLMLFNVPLYALSYVFGYNDMFWYRLRISLGRNSIVGTTIKNPSNIPKNLLADEKHTWLKKVKVFITMTVGKGCILGSEVVQTANEKDLIQGYSVFAQECKNLFSNYSPKTLNIDGWDPTKKAWNFLFPEVTTILCFLHPFLKVRERCQRYKDILVIIEKKVWDVYDATTPTQFSQRMRRLKEWTQRNITIDSVKEKLLSLCSKVNSFKIAYQYPDSHRTSNAIDRLMNYQDKLLYGMKYFHGTLESATMEVRSKALLWNFHPYCSRLSSKTKRISPFADLNGFIYHENWLQNLLIASSLRGFR